MTPPVKGTTETESVDIETVEIAFEDETDVAGAHGENVNSPDWYTQYCKITSGLCPS